MSNKTEAEYDMEAHNRKVERTLMHETIREKNMRLYNEDCNFEILDIDLYRQSQRELADVVSGDYEATYRLEYKQVAEQLDIRAIMNDKKRYEREVIAEMKSIAIMAIVWTILTIAVALYVPVVANILEFMFASAALFVAVNLGSVVFRILNINRGL